MNVREQNANLKKELDKTKLENHFLRSELNTAERAKQVLDAYYSKHAERPSFQRTMPLEGPPASARAS